MLRSFAEVIILFLAPFTLYLAGCLIYGHPLNIFHDYHKRHLSKLVLAGLLTSTIGILLLGFIFDEHKMGVFQPSVFKNGKLIEGGLVEDKALPK